MIYGISYCSRGFKNRYNKIINQAKKSKLFDNFKCYTENDIDNNFKNKNKNIWYNSGRGGGWWIWKPYIIFKLLQKIKDDDIIVYYDGGCNLNINKESIEKFNNYIKLVNKSKQGILKFRCGRGTDVKYTNKKTQLYFKNRFNLSDKKLNEIIISKQLVGGIMIIKKTCFSLNFFKEVLAILDDDNNLFTDKYNEKNELHRHDQAIMSMLYKVMEGNLIISDDTYPPNKKDCPIWASRKRK